MTARANTKRRGQRITINSDGSASLEGVRCKNLEAAIRLADRRQRTNRKDRSTSCSD